MLYARILIGSYFYFVAWCVTVGYVLVGMCWFALSSNMVAARFQFWATLLIDDGLCCILGQTIPYDVRHIGRTNIVSVKVPSPFTLSFVCIFPVIVPAQRHVNRLQ